MGQRIRLSRAFILPCTGPHSSTSGGRRGASDGVAPQHLPACVRRCWGHSADDTRAAKLARLLQLRCVCRVRVEPSGQLEMAHL